MQRPVQSLIDDQPASQQAGALAAGVALFAFAALPVSVLAVITPDTIGAATAPGADVSALVAGAALVLAWWVAFRLTVTALAAPLSHLPGAVGALACRIADAASPAVLRSLVRIAMGASVVVVPCGLSGVALADAGPAPMPTMPTMPTSVTTGVRVLPPGWLPVLDRVVGPVEATTSSAMRPAPVRAADVPGEKVVVRPGDTLWDIAARHLPAGHSDAEVATAWPRWYAANRAAIGGDPRLIRPGAVLQPPT